MFSVIHPILGDVERGIRYCENVCSTPNEKNQDVYVTLMRILMNPDQGGALGGPLANVPRHPKTSVPDLETALNILEKHADQISPMKVSYSHSLNLKLGAPCLARWLTNPDT